MAEAHYILFDKRVRAWDTWQDFRRNGVLMGRHYLIGNEIVASLVYVRPSLWMATVRGVDSNHEGAYGAECFIAGALAGARDALADIGDKFCECNVCEHGNWNDCVAAECSCCKSDCIDAPPVKVSAYA